MTERIMFFTETEKKIKDLLLFKGDFNLVGSQADPRLHFTSDYDFNQTLLKSKVPAKDLVKQLQAKVRKIKKAKNVYLGDIKAGSVGILPLRWSSDNILKGFQMVKKQKITLEKAIDEKDAKFKIDIIAFLPETGGFHEFTNVIFRYKGENDLKKIRNELINDFNDKMVEADYYKAVKRYFSFMNTFGDKVRFKNEKKNALEVLNMPTLGALHQINAGLKSLILLVESNKVKISSQRFKEELEGFKKWLWLSFDDIGNFKDFGVDNIVDLLNSLNALLNKPTLSQLKGYQEAVSFELNRQTLVQERRLPFIKEWFERNISKESF